MYHRRREQEKTFFPRKEDSLPWYFLRKGGVGGELALLEDLGIWCGFAYVGLTGS